MLRASLLQNYLLSLPPFPAYVCFPKLNGTYRYFIICLICRFIVITSKTKKYKSSIGQNTGTLTASKNVKKIAMKTDRTLECQNLNSGNRLAKGLYKKHCK